MSKLPPTATEAEINDEILFVQTLIDSLEDIDDHTERVHQRQEYDDILHHLINLLHQKDSQHRPHTPHTETGAEGTLQSGRSVDLPSRDAPSNGGNRFGVVKFSESPTPALPRKKRPIDEPEESRKISRTSESDTSPSSSVHTPATIDSFDQAEQEPPRGPDHKPLQNGDSILKSVADSRKLHAERQRAQEERYKRMKADAEFARQLHASTHAPPSYSQRTTQTFLGRDGRFERPLNPVKDEVGHHETDFSNTPLYSVKAEPTSPEQGVPGGTSLAQGIPFSASAYVGSQRIKPETEKDSKLQNREATPGRVLKQQDPSKPAYQFLNRSANPFFYSDYDDDKDSDIMEISPAEFLANEARSKFAVPQANWLDSRCLSTGATASQNFPHLVQNQQPRHINGAYPNGHQWYPQQIQPNVRSVGSCSNLRMPGSYPTSSNYPTFPKNTEPSQRSDHPSWFQKAANELHSFGIGGWLDDLGAFANNHWKSASGKTYQDPLDLDDYPELPDNNEIRSRLQARGWDYMLNDPAKTKEEIEQLLENIRPDEEMPPEMRIDTPMRMKLPLMEHQKLGLTWLKKQEEGTNKGGILADDMGLGKTIQALALMVARPSRDPVVKTNLIIAPLALMRQWTREIQEKIKPGNPMSVFVYHDKGKKGTTYAKLAKYDVVLTTFGCLAAEAGRKLKYEVDRKTNPNVPAPRLVLIGHQSQWYRVIVDEAQCIKNHNTKTAQGAFLLSATYRLCMTGTPMMNGVHELYSLIRFLRIAPYSEMQRFNRDFKNPLQRAGDEREKERAMTALQALLRAILLRRTKKSTIDGKAILNLPPRTTMVDHAVFSEDEQEFYKHLENQTALQVNKYLKAGTVGKNYSNILVLLLRLRQACCHPHLIKNHGVPGNEEVSAEDMIEFVKQLDDRVTTMIKENGGSFKCPVCWDGVENPTIFFPCGHDVCSECFGSLTDPSRAIESGRDSNDATCPECRGPVDPKKVFNFAAFCKVHPEEGVANFDHLFDQQEDAEEAEEDSEEDESDSDEVNSQGDLRDFIVADGDEDEDSEGDVQDGAEDEEAEVQGETSNKKQESKKTKKKSKGGAKGKKGKGKESKKKHKSLAELKKEGMRNAAAKKRYLKRLRRDYISSAKIDKMMEILEQIRRNDPHEKTIIFSQFTSLLDLVEVPIDEAGYRTRRYDGSMSATLRFDAVNDFMEKPEITVMLVSLKAGNAGLNLTKASQVIILDPFWNPYIEDQAIDRAHRIGQTREVVVHRILVTSTVEDRIVELQEKKRNQITQALDEKAGQSVSRLGRQELAYLFGIDRQLDR